MTLLLVEQKFATGKGLDLIALVIIWALVLYYIYLKKGEVWIRRLPALDFIDESIGRAAEMGRPVIDHIGGGSPSEENAPATVAGLSVLGYVARLTARHGVELISPMQVQSTIPMAQDVIRTAYTMEGKGDVFEANMEEMLVWAPSNANLVALIQRKRPAVHIIIGPTWHEVMQTLEMAGRLGAVNIGGTNRVIQIPIVCAVCDMSLIGEEIFAVGAYLSKTKSMVGSLAAEDWCKIATMFFSILGIVLATLGPSFVKPLTDLFLW